MDRIKEAERRTEKIFEAVLSAEFYQEQLPTMFSESKELFEEFLATETTIADVAKILGGVGMDIAAGIFDNLKNGADLASRFGRLSDEELRELGGILVDLTAIFLTAKVEIKEFKEWLSDRGKAKGAKGLVKVADKAEDAVSKVDDVAKDLYKISNKDLNSHFQKQYRLAKEAGWKRSDGTIWWPENDGFIGEKTKAKLQVGTRIDRYGNPSGKFVAPKGTPYGQRSLAKGSEKSAYNVYEVVKPIGVDAGTAAPWFDQPGGGIQYQLPMTIQELQREGYIRIITE